MSVYLDGQSALEHPDIPAVGDYTIVVGAVILPGLTSTQAMGGFDNYPGSPRYTHTYAWNTTLSAVESRIGVTGNVATGSVPPTGVLVRCVLRRAGTVT